MRRRSKLQPVIHYFYDVITNFFFHPQIHQLVDRSEEIRSYQGYTSQIRPCISGYDEKSIRLHNTSNNSPNVVTRIDEIFTNTRSTYNQRSMTRRKLKFVTLVLDESNNSAALTLLSGQYMTSRY